MAKFTGRLSAFLLIAAACLGSGCELSVQTPVGLESLNYYRADVSQIPEGAEIISSEEFLNLVQSHTLRLVQKPVPTPIATPKVSTISFHNSRGVLQTVQLMNKAAAPLMIENAAKTFVEHDNQFKIYQQLYQHIPSSHPLKESLPKPTDALNLGAAQIQRLNESVSAIRTHVVSAAPHPTADSDEVVGCAFETGAAVSDTNIGDQSSNYIECANHSPMGIYSKHNWVNKEWQGCVRNQANRGACTAFAVTSGIESLIYSKEKRHVNLSEQDLYQQALLWWFADDYTDGLNSLELSKRMMSDRFKYLFENQNAYNPSNAREFNDITGEFSNSCVNYSGDCSDFTHQAPMKCAIDNKKLYCGFVRSQSGTATNYGLSGVAQIWDAKNTEASIGYILSYVNTQSPVMLAVSVMKSFTTPDANGFIAEPIDTDEKLGQHELHLVAAISNEELSRILPYAMPGNGGGYFIAKNSWGTCFGDAGYIYVSYEWVKQNALQAVVLL